MANPQKKIVRAGASVTTPSVEGKIVEYVDSEHILDPNDPLAVQVPEQDYNRNDNPLNQHLEKSPNELSGDGPAPHVNPHTGENVEDASTPSPVPDNVQAAKRVRDVKRPGVEGDEVLTGDELESEKVEGNVVEVSEPSPDADEPNPDANESE